MIDQVRPASLDAWLQSHPGLQPVVLDVREPWELQIASVKPASDYQLVSIPMGEIPARLAELAPATPVACLCHHGARSQRVAAFLAANGFESVVNIAGGIHAWALERDSEVPVY